MAAQTGVEGVRAETMRAMRKMKIVKPSDPAKGEPRTIDGQEVRPGEWTAGPDGLPPGCPVKPLGREGQVLHVVDAIGQLQSLKPSAFGQAEIQALFHHRQNFLYWAWPRFSQKGFVDAFRAEKVRETFYFAAGFLPLFSAGEHVRGRGAWIDKGQLVYHSGDGLHFPGRAKGPLEEVKPGLHGRNFYELLPAVPPPWPAPIGVKENPAREILMGLRAWNWERPEIDPVLMLGWIGAAMLSGALEWRPNVYVTGDRATGKSSMLNFVKDVLDDGLVKSADASAAGITQKMRHDALPVALDELEAEADQRATAAILKLAKIASSGDGKLRGGADHSGVEFVIRSCFLFSSINPPGLRPEDVSRMAILRLRPLAEKKDRLREVPTIDADRCGPMLLRLLMDNWVRFRPAFEAYSDVLREAGHPDRGQKTFGTLLTCADLMLGPELAEELGVPMVDDLGRWGELLAVDDMPEYQDMSDNWRACLKHLLTSQVEAWRGGKRATVGQLLEDIRNDPDCDVRSANGELAQAGLKVIFNDPKIAPGLVLCIPNESQLVAKLFKDTRFVGAPGASVWKSALRQAPPALVCTDKTLNRQRINGVQERCTLVKMNVFEDLGI